jgi:hypothetical protein
MAPAPDSALAIHSSIGAGRYASASRNAEPIRVVGGHGGSDLTGLPGRSRVDGSNLDLLAVPQVVAHGSTLVQRAQAGALIPHRRRPARVRGVGGRRAPSGRAQRKQGEAEVRQVKCLERIPFASERKRVKMLV